MKHRSSLAVLWNFFQINKNISFTLKLYEAAAQNQVNINDSNSKVSEYKEMLVTKSLGFLDCFFFLSYKLFNPLIEIVYLEKSICLFISTSSQAI